MSNILLVLMAILCVLLLACIARAIMGPRYTDRIVMANAMNTLATALIVILSVYLGESYLLDVAIIYALLGFLSVVVITRVATFRHYGTQLHKEDLQNDDR